MIFNIELWKVIAVLIIIFFLIIASYIIYRKIVRFFRGMALEVLDKNVIKEKWGQIEDLLDRKNIMSYKLAVMEADKLFDYVLKHMHFPGSTMGERLKAACYKYEKLRSVWWPHKVRNQIVHESTYEINYKTARAAINTFKKGMEELGVL